MRPVLAIGLVVLGVLLVLFAIRLIPARYTVSIEGTGGNYRISLSMTANGRDMEQQSLRGTLPDQLSFWSTKPWVGLSYGSEWASTLTLRRWGKVCGTSSSMGGFAMAEPVQCEPGGGLF